MLKSEFFLSMKGYNRQTFFKDLMSGILVAIVALPLSIAFGIQSGLTLQQGIITAIVSGFFISFLGGSKFQIGGPTVTFVALCFGYVSNPEIGILGMQVAVFFGGIILVIMAFLRLGNSVKYIPVSVVVGFTSANGLMLLVGQLKDFFGMELPANTASEVIPKLGALFQNISTVNLATALIGALAVAIIILVPKINKKIPAVLFSLLTVTIVTAILGLLDGNAFGIATIGSKYGDVKPTLDLPYFEGLKTLNYTLLIAPAFIIAMLATMEGLLSATVADGMTGTRHNSNKELFGLGIANMASSLVGGLPATGVLARTATNINSGGKTPMAGIIHSLVLLIMYLVLMPLVKFIPLTALAAILITVSAKLINIKKLIKVVKFNIKDSFIMVLTFVLCIVFSLIVGVVVGISATIIFTLFRLIKNKMSIQIEVEKVFDLVPIKDVDLIMQIAEQDEPTSEENNDNDFVIDSALGAEMSDNINSEKSYKSENICDTNDVSWQADDGRCDINTLGMQAENERCDDSNISLEGSEIREKTMGRKKHKQAELSGVAKAYRAEILQDIYDIIIASDDVDISEEIELEKMLIKDIHFIDKKDKRNFKRKIREAERIRLKGNINFINVVSLAKKIEKELTHHSIIIVDLENVNGVDLTAVEKLQSIIDNAEKLRKRVVICNANETVKRKFDKYKI